VLPVCRRHGMGVLTWSPLAGGFLSGAYRQGRPVDLTRGRPGLQPERFDPSLPENAAKLELVERLIVIATEIGCTLPELALAFPLAHPAVTSVIIGPRTLPQLDQLLAGAGLALDDRTLDRIDEIVAPGADHYRITWRPPELDDASTRRRPATARAAAG
jgi:aryl-alcohol dehydrogenase-like predicted oxidoreductase